MASPRRGVTRGSARPFAAPAAAPAAPAPAGPFAARARPDALDVGTERFAVGRHGGGGDPVLPALHLVALLARGAGDDVEEIEGFGEEGLADERSGRKALAVSSRQEPFLREEDLSDALALPLGNDEALLEAADDPVDGREGRARGIRIGALEHAPDERIVDEGEQRRVAELGPASGGQVQGMERLALELEI